MLKGKNLTYIRHEKIEGTSQKTGLPYCFASVTLSDGLESFKLDMKPELANQINGLRKGDNVEITVDIGESFNRTTFLVSAVDLAKSPAKVV